jgi:hypothetical protein
MRRIPSRPICRTVRRLARRALHTLPALLLLVLPALAARAHPGDAAPGPFAGYRLVEVSYLLQAPDGSLLRVTRTPVDAATALPGPRGGSLRAQPVFGLQGWVSGLLFRSPRIYRELSDYVKESWETLLRLLDYLGVVVLLAGTWAIWFLVRPALPGVPERAAFLLIFALVAALWSYVTGLYLSVAYALGLMLLPAACLLLAGWLLRRLWRALRGAAAPA